MIGLQSAVNEATFEVLYDEQTVTKTQQVSVVFIVAKILAFSVTS